MEEHVSFISPFVGRERKLRTNPARLASFGAFARSREFHTDSPARKEIVAASAQNPVRPYPARPGSRTAPGSHTAQEAECGPAAGPPPDENRKSRKPGSPPRHLVDRLRSWQLSKPRVSGSSRP